MSRFRGFCHKVYNIVRDFLARNQDNAVEAYAAQAALFIIISFFPAAILLMALVPLLPFSEAQVVDIFVEIVPDAIADFARSILEELYTTSASISAISITAVMALWSASKGSLAMMRGLNRIYGVRRKRNYLLWRLIAALYMLLFFLVLMIILVFLGVGNRIFHWLSQWFPILGTSVFVKGSIQFLFSLVLLFIVFWLLYTTVPQRRTNPLREIPGALVAAAGWVGFSLVYSHYLNYIGRASLYYGSLSLVMFTLIWLYFCMYIFFVGAEVNVWLREAVPPRSKKKKHQKHKTDKLRRQS